MIGGKEERGAGTAMGDDVAGWVREAAGFNKGLVQDIAGMHAAAVDTFTAAAAASHSNIDALRGRALALRSLRRYRDAARDYISVLGYSGGSEGPAPTLPWSRRPDSRPASPAVESPPPGGGGGAGGGVGGGSGLVGRHGDGELLRVLRKPAAARSEEQVVMLGGLLGEVAFFR